MSRARIRIAVPPTIDDVVRRGPVRDALADLAQLGRAELCTATNGAEGPIRSVKPDEWPIRYHGRTVGYVQLETSGESAEARRASQAATAILEHALEREEAVRDLSAALMTSYEELNLLYTLLPSMATKVDPSEIAQVLVDETSRTLGCRRVSLLLLDEKHETYRVLASRGLPVEARSAVLPVSDSIAAQALWDDDLLVVDDIGERPDLARLSRGAYQSRSFAVVRVPLTARGEALGFLTVTERIASPEFTAHDRKLLEGLSAMGASSLLNCRLHAAVNTQMLSTIHALASAVDAKDQYTHDHSGRVAGLCVATARFMGIEDVVVIREVELAGLLHDIGKIGITDAILSKPSRLTPEEFAIMQEHARIGARIVENVPGLEGVAKAILHHHERFDGLGYPDGLSGEAIPLASSLIAVSDAFDAMTSDRPYRSARPVDQAVPELHRCRGTQFNPKVVDTFVSIIERDSDAGGGPLPPPFRPPLRSGHGGRSPQTACSINSSK